MRKNYDKAPDFERCRPGMVEQDMSSILCNLRCLDTFVFNECSLVQLIPSHVYR